MIDEFILFFVILFVVATLLRGDIAFTIFYLFAGAFILGQSWNKYAINKIRIERTFVPRAFLGEDIPVKLKIKNTGYLPVIWLRVYESIPIILGTIEKIKEVVSLNPLGHAEITYNLHARKRGYYPVGPLFVSSNDIFGLLNETDFEGKSDHLTVYPKIIPLTNAKLPSRSPLGTLRHYQPIFEDPARVLSKRDYVAGDSLRRLDWKASAAIGRLQVKQYEPSIALETIVFLNLNKSEYPTQHRIDSTELGIVITASLANWIISQKQSIGLVTNGIDPMKEELDIKPIPSRKGRGHLMRILDILARVQVSERTSFETLVRQQSPHLPWGTTLILITGRINETLFDEVFQAQRRGQNVVVVLAGTGTNIQESKRRAEYFGLPVYSFATEDDLLDVWSH